MQNEKDNYNHRSRYDGLSPRLAQRPVLLHQRNNTCLIRQQILAHVLGHKLLIYLCSRLQRMALPFVLLPFSLSGHIQIDIAAWIFLLK